ncbi:uncharacterized protein LOC124131349 isoform X1 [Haliotis rufescens]|uniref:uncharacterized protein LOC124131349 isoform X1 n=1 Tax=Haliotis rufescens TaxID=6454 RepID=UPI00201F65F1|nr:uncharacterized protein LOC124131349 isoform X1 [Haliotis rufescens]
MFYLSVLLYGLAAGATNQGILSLFQQKFTGDGTYYGHTDTGMCQYNPPSLPPAALNPKIKYTVALNKPQFQDSFGCGMCFKVHGSGKGSGNSPITGDFFVFANNLCPECHAGSLDFAVSGDGRWNIEIQAVQCPVGNTNIEYKFQGTNPYYIKLQVRNARIPVTEAEMMQGGNYVSMKHTADGFWELSNGHQVDQTGGVGVKLTAANGDTVTDIIPNLNNNVVLHGKNQVQFKLDPSLPTA